MFVAISFLYPVATDDRNLCARMNNEADVRRKPACILYSPVNSGPKKALSVAESGCNLVIIPLGLDA